PPEKRWREPTEWTRTNVRVSQLSYTASHVTQCVAVNPLTDEAILYLQGLSSRERSRGEVQPVDEPPPAHELRAAHAPPYSQSSELSLLYSQPPYSRSSG